MLNDIPNAFLVSVARTILATLLKSAVLPLPTL